jgi:hypothetical protein
MTATKHIEALRGLLGDNAVLAEATDIVAYETGARYDKGKACAALMDRTGFGDSVVLRATWHCPHTAVR